MAWHGPRGSCGCCNCLLFDIDPNAQTDEVTSAEIAKYTASPSITIETHADTQQKISIAASGVLESELVLPVDNFYVSFSGIDSFWTTSVWPAIEHDFLVEFFAAGGSYSYGDGLLASYKHEFLDAGFGADPFDPTVALKHRFTLYSKLSDFVFGDPEIVVKSRQFVVKPPTICVFDDTYEVYGARVQPTSNGEAIVGSYTTNPTIQGSVYSNIFLQSQNRQRYNPVAMVMRITNLSATDPLELYRIVAGKIGQGIAPKCIAVPKRNPTYILNAPIAFSSDIGAPDTVAPPNIAGHEPLSLIEIDYGVITDPGTGEPITSNPLIEAPAYDVDTVTTSVPGVAPGTVRRQTEQYFYFTSFTQNDLIYREHQIRITPTYRLAGKIGLSISVTLGFQTTTGTSADYVTESLTTYTITTTGTDSPDPPPWTEGTVTTTIPAQDVIFAGWGGLSWNLTTNTINRVFVVEVDEWGVGAFPGFTLHCRAAADAIIAGVKHISIPDVDTGVPDAVIEIEFWRTATERGSIFTRDTTWPDTIDIINAGDFYDEP